MLDIKSDIEFLNTCKMMVNDYTKIHSDSNEDFEVYVVWYCKTLQNFKALLSTSLPDKMYYECTYNGDAGELYFDAYKKCDHVIIGK